MRKNNNSLLNFIHLQRKEATNAFTLVELIVVITILAILGTIAFISLQGYSQDSRDAVRISDISRIKTSVELFQLGSGKYPLPTDITEITYSGALAWSQGLFGEDTFKNVTNLDKIPLDPSTDKQYVYSVTNTRQEYQVAGIIEGEIAYNSSQVQAGEKTATLKISGTYNGKLLKVSTGGTDYVLAVPSIITSTGFTVEQIASNDYFAYNGYKNLPAQYEGGAYKLLGSEGLNLVDGTNILVYSGSVSTLSSTKQDGIDARKQMLENLQSAYTGSQISHIGEISEILSLDTENTDDTEKLSLTIVSNNLGGRVVTNSSEENNETEGNTDIIIDDPFLENCGTQIGQVIYNTDDFTDTGLTCSDNIAICNGNSGSGIIIQSCNLGANSVASSYSDSNAYGNYYQFGRNCSYESDSINCWTNGNSTINNDWLFPGGTDAGSANLWGVKDSDKTIITYNNSTNIDKLKMQGPCPSGYHIPTQKEWDILVTIGGWQNNGIQMSNQLKMPAGGARAYNNSSYYSRGNEGFYWSSSPRGDLGYAFNLYTSTVGSYYANYRSAGKTIRCFKN